MKSSSAWLVIFRISAKFWLMILVFDRSICSNDLEPLEREMSTVNKFAVDPGTADLAVSTIARNAASHAPPNVKKSSLPCGNSAHRWTNRSYGETLPLLVYLLYYVFDCTFKCIQSDEVPWKQQDYHHTEEIMRDVLCFLAVLAYHK